MTDILLVALNAKYIHSGLGQRCLLANLGDDLKKRAELVECDINRRASEIAEIILSKRAKILAFGIYIWNVRIAEEVLSLIRRIEPELKIVLGGPEVSFPDDLPDIEKFADYIICGEGENSFRNLCKELLDEKIPSERIILPNLPDLTKLALPYSLYSEDDIANRVVYVESSRGCPYGCMFCLSSLDKKIRYFDRSAVFNSLNKLIKKGCYQFKFTDRTFNANLDYACELLEFFLSKSPKNFFLHFEAVPDKLPDRIRNLLIKFPAKSLQLEMGLQTLNVEVAQRISRFTDLCKAEENIKWLRKNTNVYLHTDLIIGLPGEDIQSFAKGFDQLLAWDPHEIQVGILKRLRGAPIIHYQEDFEMVFSSLPPYEILKSNTLDYRELCDLKRFSKFWDIVCNSGRFVQTSKLIWKGTSSAFFSFFEFSKWLFGKLNCQSGVALSRLARLIEQYLIEIKNYDSAFVGELMQKDLNGSSNAKSLAKRQQRAS